MIFYELKSVLFGHLDRRRSVRARTPVLGGARPGDGVRAVVTASDGGVAATMTTDHPGGGGFPTRPDAPINGALALADKRRVPDCLHLSSASARK